MAAGDDRIAGGAGFDTLYGGAGGDIIAGASGDDGIYDGNGADSVSGGDGNDSIYTGFEPGNPGVDALDGGAGIDTLNVSGAGTGGALYFIYNLNLKNRAITSDKKFQNFEVFNVDNHVSSVIAAGVIDITVNLIDGGLNNILDTSGYSTLNAPNEINLMTGDANLGRHFNGFSRVVAGDTANTIVGSAGDDIITTGAGDDTISGGNGDDKITSATGTDTLSGGNGNDTFIVAGGNITIDGGAGTDTIDVTEDNATVDLSITDTQTSGDGQLTISNVENLTSTGSRDTLVGNAADNVLTGGYGNDVLDGGAGDDILDGGYYGNDTVSYASANAGVTVTLSTAARQDTIGAGLDTIASNIENLSGSGFNDILTGDGGTSILTGGDGDDLLDGLGGKDTLTGGGGADQFAFTTALGQSNIDRIADFTVGEDLIDLDHAIFTGLAAGALPDSAFYVGSAAHDADDRLIFNASTGALYFDSDGLGGAAQVQFATVATGLNLSASSFAVS